MRLSLALLASIVFAAVGSSTIPAQQHAANTPIPTTSGLLTGVVSKYAPDVTTYLSIPFALPPTGRRRWAPPVRFTSQKPLNASKYGPDCPSLINVDIPGVFQMTEDCLYLNVFVPPNKGGSTAPKAVMLWFYGGAFMGGSAEMGGMTDGSILAKRGDVIVVTMNYRLSIFGFPGSPGLKDQNAGLHDHRVAAEWLRDNIAAFGGDPKKITLFGQSAGAVAADIYSYAWTKDPIVSGLILESGASTLCGLVTNASYVNWPKVAKAVGCSGAPDKELECMLGKSMAEIQRASVSLLTWPPPFAPSSDGKVAFDDYPARMDNGAFIKVPIIAGNNNREVWGVSSINEQAFTCPAKYAVEARIAQGIPSYRYRFYGGDTAASAKSWSLSNPSLHMAEVVYVFGSFDSSGIAGSVLVGAKSTQKLAVASMFQDVWSAFARDPQNGPKKYGWPVYQPNGKTLVSIMYAKETEPSLRASTEFDGNCKPSKLCEL